MMNEQEYFKAAKACAALTMKEADNDIGKGMSLLHEKVTSHRPDAQRKQILQKTLVEFRKLYSEDRKQTEALTPELKDSDFNDRVELAAWTMMTHSLFNLELAKVKR
jgi:hypothetical protein